MKNGKLENATYARNMFKSLLTNKNICVYICIYIYIYIYMDQTGSTQTAKTMIAPVASDDLAILDRTLP